MLQCYIMLIGGGADYKSRYFKEDFPFGLKIIVDLADRHSVKVPVMERVLSWGLSKI